MEGILMERQIVEKPIEKHGWRRWWRVLGVVVVALVLGAFMHATLALAAPNAAPKAASLAQSSPDHDGEGEGDFQHRDGVLVSRPDGNEGTWVISDTELVSYTANGATELIGELVVGACVDVKTSMGDSETALRIGVTEPENCNKDEDGGDGGGDDGDLHTVEGIINSRPDVNAGTWVISGTEYTVNDDTILEGELHINACVEVTTKAGEPAVAVKIEAKEASECNVGDDDGGGDGGGDNHEITTTFGIIQHREQKAGVWVISGKSYTVTLDTELEEEHGGLPVRGCVAVTTLLSDPTTAIKIASQEKSKCGLEDNDEIISVKGIVKSRPGDKVGPWVIDEKTFTATESTTFEGNVDVGACVEVKSRASAPHVAISIEAKEAADCNGDDNGGGDGGGEHHGDDERIVKFGILQSRPDEKVGVWMIGGEAYSVTEQTEIDFEHGRLMPGVCIRVTVAKNNPTVARALQSDRTFMCRRDDNDDAKGTIFGLIERLPADLHNGTWVIGGFSFVVSPTTELIDNGQVFTTGETVKVDFVTNISNTNFARRIEIKFGPSNPCWRDFHESQAAGEEHPGDDGNHSFGRCPGFEGKAMGAIDSRPEGTLLGQWMIGGVPYLTNAFTKFANGDDFLVGDHVKVEYIVLNVNQRFATRIMEIHDGGGVGEPNGSMIVGTVDEKPDAFIGNWVIDGAPFVAISDTIFIEHGSLFAKGAFVVVEYHITNDQRLIDKIVTYVPPGAGDEDHVGHLETMGASMAAASVDAPSETSQVWTVDGVNYTVTDATMLVDNGGALAPGATVYVNSYTDNGQRFATMIRTQAGLTFIPMATK
jgi:hypothetical protein